LPHTDAAGARILGQRTLRSLSEAQVDVSMGMSASRPGHASDLRQEADAAMSDAKRRGGNQLAIFDDIRDDVSVIGSDKRAALHRLLAEGHLTTVFQPIWSLADDCLLGVEALSRPDASYGLASPAEAFDIAERTGHVHALDVICVKSALASAGDLPEGALLFLNLCPSTLGLDADGNDWLRAAVGDSGVPVARIVIEVTERFGGRTTSIIKCLHRLRSQGFKIAIDDVGTGNSGLAMLREVEVEFVKLDGSIVAAAATEPGARAVLMAIAAFARQTGAFVIAEGVEDEETLEFLRSMDGTSLRGGAVIQGGQGYGLGRPATGIPTTLRLPARPLPLAA
jgi:EAL domain-containing protein (putative c-di-GMP-specific phosphodiesterase class I)